MAIRYLFILLFAFCDSAYADTAEAQRAEFRRAYVELADPTHRDAEPIDRAALQGYVLYPYLEAARLRRALSTPPGDLAALDRDFESFLAAHEKEPVASEPRRLWLASLASRREWEKFLAYYKETSDPTLQCHALNARLALEKTENLIALATTVWANAPDSRPVCEPTFTWLKSQNALTDALIEKRARLALAAGNAAFARQMIALLPPEKAEPLETWAALIERPRAAIDAAIAQTKKPIETPALLDGWIRLVRADASAGISRFPTLVKARALAPETASRFALELALSLAWSRRPEALDYFAKVRPEELDTRAYEWWARAALWAGRWAKVSSIIEAMPRDLAGQTKWKYWAARALELRGKTTAAKQQYAALLSDDNYYAALAAARLGKPYTPTPHPFALNEESIRSLATLASFVRARELLAVDIPDLRSSAYEEWRVGYASLDAAAKVQAVGLAAQWGWHDQAILTASQLRMFDDYELLYPHPYDEEVHAAAEIVDLPPELIYATLRQESLYRTDAQSVAGARGLMQLVDDTARRTARRWPKVAAAIESPKELNDPKTNIYIGSAHLRDTIDRFNGNVAVALAGYNAGPAVPQRWFPKKSIDADIWIENIPYNETRVYVQRILWHSVVFGWVATRKAQTTTQWLTQVKPNG